MFVDTKKTVFTNIFLLYNYYILLLKENRGGENMGRPKGGTNQQYTVKEKYNMIKEVVTGILSTRDAAKKYNVSRTNIFSWATKYQENGMDGLRNSRKPGNPLAKYQRRKDLTEIEKLEYENMKLRIENERLKKGYTSKEADQAKQKK